MNFKVILALSASLTAFNAMADCLGDICTGERVINGYNEISTVIAIDNSESKVVTKNSSSSLKSYSASELSDEVSSSSFPAGKTVMDEYNIQGSVSVVFRNGKVVYRRNGYSSDNISSTSNLTPEISEIRNLRNGSRIIDEYNIRGQVARLFQNGSVFYRRDGYSSDNMASANNLTLRVNNLGELSKETEIIDEYNIAGKVTDMYSDGRTFYRRNGYSSDNMTSTPRNLVLKVSSVNGLSENTSIIDEYNITGRVSTLYKDGRVFYRRNGYSSDNMTQSNKLVVEVSNLDEIKQGTFAIDEYNLPGKVSNLFADGRMIFKRDGYSSSNVVTKIYPEVGTHKVYSKNTRYASDSLKLGNPSNFFSNGMILHAGNVVSDLYEAVEQYEGITKDSELVSILGKVSKSKEIFANGVVALNNKEATVSKIVIYKNIKHKEQFLSNLARLVLNKVANEKDDSTLSLSFISSEAAIVKEDLMAAIKKSDDYSMNKEMKKKMIELLAGVVMPGDADIKDPEEYSLSVTPAEIIDDVKAILDQDQKKYVFVSPAAAKSARKSIIVDISRSLLKTTCSVVIKERNVEIKNVSKKIGKKDTEDCLVELKD